MAITHDELIQHLRTVFHTYGYDGASLSLISQATGLGKGSLYHHFPNGKQEMASAVLAAEGVWFEQALTLLREAGEPQARLARFIEFIRLTEQDKTQASTLDVYTMGNARLLFGADMGLAVQQWIAALQQLIIDAGINEAQAKQRAIAAIAQLEGARLLCRCLDDWHIFEQLLQQLPQDLLAS
ncbi:TetR/AcrR family transcriptional regulator [Chitinibacter sp. SCUT-21]|uniref:TetR/AcrR family transcriptional regulator n=1 Tax=Chitinibacter sp. SCUT-21 TaxID=2970891 RepID=UPI0035A63CF5